MKIYHNPRCSKSRKGLAYLEEKGCKFDVVKYLDEGFSEQELSELISQSGKKPFDFVRQHEQLFKEEYKGKELSDQEWITVLVENPRLIHRPIVVNNGKAVLGNPPENIDEIL